MPGPQQDRDLVLPPFTYAYVQDNTRGTIEVLVGPVSTSPSQQQQMVTWTGKKFAPTNDMNQATQSFIRASESQYVVLSEPAVNDPENFPHPGKQEQTNLSIGKKIVIPGPTTFALWPGQSADVIDGHHLNYNQYLLAQVYEPEAARENLGREIAEPAEGETSANEAREYRMGERIVKRGTEVSYYVPPTGIEVLPEKDKTNIYVREAATLEQLEYCVLRDENGRKRYQRGPAVIFPEPTETFVTEKNERKFRATELSAQSGLFIKVTADYMQEEPSALEVWRGGKFVAVGRGERVLEGDELFLTGETTPIYFPRAEHSVIQFEEQRRIHHAVAVPTGEGRYVLDREHGIVNLVQGPSMLLPDPRTQAVVRRVLDAKAVSIMYPGNEEAAQINARLRTELAAAAEEYLPVAQASVGEVGSLAVSYQATQSFAGERFRRTTENRPPESITLDTKYQGAVAISPWPGYAVLVMNKSGDRRVELGPVNLLLEYDETLMALRLSTGRPKTDQNPYETVYLRVINNAVSDRVTVETRDLVPVTIDLSLRVNFEGEDQERWFDVEDYVALLTDHVRSRLRNLAKSHDVQTFNRQAIDLIRDSLLGKVVEGKRKGLPFEENGMRLYDVEVLNISIDHPGVGQLLHGATLRALEGAVQLTEAREHADRQGELEAINRDLISEREQTAIRQAHADQAAQERDREAAFAEILDRIKLVTEEAKIASLHRDQKKAEENQRRQLVAARDEVDLKRAAMEVKHFVDRMGAVDSSLVEALRDFGDQFFVEKITDALGPAAMAAGVRPIDLFHQIFAGTPFEGITKTLGERSGQNGHQEIGQRAEATDR